MVERTTVFDDVFPEGFSCLVVVRITDERALMRRDEDGNVLHGETNPALILPAGWVIDHVNPYWVRFRVAGPVTIEAARAVREQLLSLGALA